MPKISDNFQYDVFKFIIESRRNALLSRWLGDPDLADAEKSIQGQFEAIQANIAQLPELYVLDSDKVQPRLLAWLLGWDDNPLVDFVDDLSDDQLKKLIELSVPLWKNKGTAGAIVNLLRIFTGKTALIRDWFWYRWVIDGSGFWQKARGTDPYLVGSQYTEADEWLTWIILNRVGIGETERRLIYDLLTFIRPTGEHFGVVYAAFADDFANGFSQWTQIGTPGTLVTTEGDYRGGLLQGAEVQTNIPTSEHETWTPFQRSIVHIEFAGTGADETITLEGMRSEDGSTWYRARLRANGALRLSSSQPYTLDTTLTLPTPGTPVSLELRVEPIDTAQTKVSVYVGAELQSEHTFLGVDAYVDSAGGVTVSRSGVSTDTTYIDNVLVLASPARIQMIGQQAITPTPGLGGPTYIADPAPDLEPFVG